ncbi:TerD family protein [Gordonia sp. HY285]|uniref:TerD family protein n=1 Tax=Gordonia liuliyuniae TaxID=2911517 RepID=UPI001F182679|nr:TerD family protein [Gordonia liuliyuniae]MCF8608778.1 TerD family protein [Gordonia liuliyuniae]
MTPTLLSKGANLTLSSVSDVGEITVTIEVVADGDLTTDASVLLLGADGRVRSNDDLIFYNQANSADDSVRLLERTGQMDGISRDAVRIELARLAEDVDRVIVGASVDDPFQALGAASSATMIVADVTTTLARFSIEGLTTERALVFGEVYRRGEEWKLRAVGQGYADGLGALVTEFGIEVDPAVDPQISTPIDVESPEPAPPVPTPTNVQIRRQRRAPCLPSDWDDRPSAYLPTEPAPPAFHRATLFPAVHAKASINHEQRATSILLATMEIVREFGRAVLGSIGAPGGRVTSFVEPAFTINGAESRPDGLIRVTRGATTWTALVEVKIGARRLAADQVATYMAVAKSKGYDAVITISPDLMPVAGALAVTPDPKLLKSISLHHIAWEEIISAAAVTLEHTGIDNCERARLLHEFLTYAVHPSSGMHVFDDMGSHWARVRDAVKTRTVSAHDSAPAEVCQNFDRLVRHIALQLSAMLGQRVQAVPPAEHRDAVSRARQLADSGRLFGTLRTAGLVGPIVVEADLTRDRAICSITIAAPRNGRPLTHVNWMLRQLSDADSRTRVVSHHAGCREQTALLLGDARNDPGRLVPGGGRGIREFTVSVDRSTGTKRAGPSGGFAATVTHLVTDFYGTIASVLKAAPPSP